MQGTLVRSHKGSRKIPQAAEQQSPCTTTTEPMLYSPRVATTEPPDHSDWSLGSLPRAHTPQQEKPPQWKAHPPQLEKAHIQPRRPIRAKRIKINKQILERMNQENKTHISWNVSVVANCSFCRQFSLIKIHLLHLYCHDYNHKIQKFS